MDLLRLIADLAFQLLMTAGILLLIIKSRRKSAKPNTTNSISNVSNRQQMNLKRKWQGIADINSSSTASVSTIESTQPVTLSTPSPATAVAAAATAVAMAADEAMPVIAAVQTAFIEPEMKAFPATVEDSLQLSTDEPDVAFASVSEVLASQPNSCQLSAVGGSVFDDDVTAVTTEGVDCYISEIERLTMENNAYRNQIAVMQTDNKRLEEEISGMLQLLQIVQSQSSRRSSESLKTAMEDVDGLLSSEAVELSMSRPPSQSPPPMAAEFDEIESTHFDIVFVGDSNVGKTSFIRRICNDNYNEMMPTFRATTGVDFLTKTLDINRCTVILQLWDTAGQERYRSLTKQYFRKADGVVIMYDVTSETSFCNVRSWIDSVQANSIDGTVFILVGNKMDLMDDNAIRAVDEKDGSELAKNFGAAAFSEVSAKTGAGCYKVIDDITRVLLTLRREKTISDNTQPSINLSSRSPDGYDRRLQSTCCGRQFSLNYRKKTA